VSLDKMTLMKCNCGLTCGGLLLFSPGIDDKYEDRNDEQTC